jgi:hypothetical protein
MPFKLFNSDVVARSAFSVHCDSGVILGYVRIGTRNGGEVYLWSDTNAAATDRSAWHFIGVVSDTSTFHEVVSAYVDVPGVPAPGGNGAEIDDASDPMWPIEPGDHNASEGTWCDAAMVAQSVHQAQGVVSLGGRYVALADGGVEWVPDAPAMVPQPVQQQQGNAGARILPFELQGTLKATGRHCSHLSHHRSARAALRALASLSSDPAWEDARIWCARDNVRYSLSFFRERFHAGQFEAPAYR